MPMPFSPAGQALGLAGILPGMGGFGDATETEEERRKLRGADCAERGCSPQNASPASSALGACSVRRSVGSAAATERG